MTIADLSWFAAEEPLPKTATAPGARIKVVECDTSGHPVREVADLGIVTGISRRDGRAIAAVPRMITELGPLFWECVL